MLVKKLFMEISVQNQLRGVNKSHEAMTSHLVIVSNNNFYQKSPSLAKGVCLLLPVDAGTTGDDVVAAGVTVVDDKFCMG